MDNARQFREVMEKNPRLLEKLAHDEHQRWSRFMRSEGYVQATWENLMCFYPELEVKANKDVLGKRHLCLVEWEQLDVLNRKYLSLDPPEKRTLRRLILTWSWVSRIFCCWQSGWRRLRRRSCTDWHTAHMIQA